MRAASAGIPALLLQPLVENAVKHGIAGLIEGGVIRLAVDRTGDYVHVSVENASSTRTMRRRHAWEGTARTCAGGCNVRYGDSATFETTGVDGMYRVDLTFPLHAGCMTSRESEARSHFWSRAASRWSPGRSRCLAIPFPSLATTARKFMVWPDLVNLNRARHSPSIS